MVLARVSTAVDLEIPEEGGIIDATWVAATPSGFAVVDRMSSSIGFFDDSGEWFGHVGSPGEGPGEFSDGIFHAVSVGDRLWLSDIRHRRLNVIDASIRTRVDSSPLDVMQGVPWALLSPGGDELAATVMSWGFGSEPRTMSLSLWTGDALEPAFSWVVDESRRGWASGTPVVEGAEDGTVALLDLQVGVIRVYDLEGNVILRYAFAEDAVVELTEDDRTYLERLHAPVRVRQEQDVARRLRALVDRAPESVRGQLSEAAAGQFAQESIFNDRYPLFLDARFDPESETIWLARPLTAGEMRELPVQLGWDVLRRSARYWDAYGFDGSFRYRLEVPLGFVATDARDGRFYGYEIDALGLRHVVVLSVP
ncbi:hypothetical protein [Candidatus Palauibacter sp.]|uniref:hypothetical protein n=1 Tax=Candidatus Palauibacter sp. TaxID=3101350 RepID=UPI003B5933A4